MKKVLSAVMAALMTAATLSSCGQAEPQTSESETEESSAASIVSEQAEENASESASSQTESRSGYAITTSMFYFNDELKCDKAVVTYFNSKSGKSMDQEMTLMNEDEKSRTFGGIADFTLYNMAYITCDGKKTKEFAFNRCMYGWYRTADDFFPFNEMVDINKTPHFDDVTLKGYGYEKKIHIWLPDDYDKSSEWKYSTIYVLDGQSIADFGRADYNPSTRQGVIEQVESMDTKLLHNQAIIVAVESNTARDYELIPDLEMTADEKKAHLENIDAEEPEENEDFDCMSAMQFASFMANRLVPYIQQNYNVYTDAEHTTITGSSLGGIESFYITLEYPDVFGCDGSLSPSFYEYDDAAWRAYLGEKSLGSDTPLIYFYTGPEGKDTDPDVTEMYNRLIEMGCPESRIVLHYDENGEHSGICWRSVFSEYLSFFTFHRVDPLQE